VKQRHVAARSRRIVLRAKSCHHRIVAGQASEWNPYPMGHLANYPAIYIAL